MNIVTYSLVLISFLSCKNKQKDIIRDLNKSSLKRDTTERVKISEKANVITKCDFETYVIYRDSLPLFDKPNGKIVKYFRFENDPEYDFGGGFLFKDSQLGWLQIGKDSFNPNLENFWVKSEFIQIGTTNYDNSLINLYKEPDENSESIGYIKEASYLNVLNCHSGWAYVKKNDNQGWLSPEFICTNSETNCN